MREFRARNEGTMSSTTSKHGAHLRAKVMSKRGGKKKSFAVSNGLWLFSAGRGVNLFAATMRRTAQSTAQQFRQTSHPNTNADTARACVHAPDAEDDRTQRFEQAEQVHHNQSQRPEEECDRPHDVASDATARSCVLDLLLRLRTFPQHGRRQPESMTYTLIRNATKQSTRLASVHAERWRVCRHEGTNVPPEHKQSVQHHRQARQCVPTLKRRAQ